MPVQRRSCEPCFQGKRKCDTKHPVCNRCQDHGKACYYRYAISDSPGLAYESPQQPPTSFDSLPDDLELANVEGYDFQVTQDSLPLDFDMFNMFSASSGSGTDLSEESNLVESLGAVRPRSDAVESLQWVRDQLQACPKDFSTTNGTMFINHEMYKDELPSPIILAFALCTASTSITESNQLMFSRSLNATIADLVQHFAPEASIEDELAKLQTILLCEIMLSNNGASKERSLAEQRQTLVETRALQLLQKLKSETWSPAPLPWKSWILHESVRRTVLLVFLLHSIESISKHRVCVQIALLSRLPVSSNARFWISEAEYVAGSDDETVRYSAFTDSWVFLADRSLDAFERLILVACKGVEWASKNCL